MSGLGPLSYVLSLWHDTWGDQLESRVPFGSWFQGCQSVVGWLCFPLAYGEAAPHSRSPWQRKHTHLMATLAAKREGKSQDPKNLSKDLSPVTYLPSVDPCIYLPLGLEADQWAFSIYAFGGCLRSKPWHSSLASLQMGGGAERGRERGKEKEHTVTICLLLLKTTLFLYLANFSMKSRLPRAHLLLLALTLALDSVCWCGSV